MGNTFVTSGGTPAPAKAKSTQKGGPTWLYSKEAPNGRLFQVMGPDGKHFDLAATVALVEKMKAAGWVDHPSKVKSEDNKPEIKRSGK